MGLSGPLILLAFKPGFGNTGTPNPGGKGTDPKAIALYWRSSVPVASNAPNPPNPSLAPVFPFLLFLGVLVGNIPLVGAASLCPWCVMPARDAPRRLRRPNNSCADRARVRMTPCVFADYAVLNIKHVSSLTMLLALSLLLSSTLGVKSKLLIAALPCLTV